MLLLYTWDCSLYLLLYLYVFVRFLLGGGEKGGSAAPFSVVVLDQKSSVTPLTKRESLGSLSRTLTRVPAAAFVPLTAVVCTASSGMLFVCLFVVAGFLSGREAR